MGNKLVNMDFGGNKPYYEHSVKVPAILSWRGNLPEGVLCDRVISSPDLNATMLDALNTPPLPNCTWEKSPTYNSGQ